MAAAVDAVVRHALAQDEAFRAEHYGTRPVPVRIAVDGLATAPLEAEWAASGLPVVVLASAQPEGLEPGVLRVSVTPGDGPDGDDIWLDSEWQPPSGGCFKRHCWSVDLSWIGASVTSRGFWYSTP